MRSLAKFFAWFYWKLNMPFLASFVEALLGFGYDGTEVDGWTVVRRVDKFLKEVNRAVFIQFVGAVATLPLVPPPALPRSHFRRALVELRYGLISFFYRAPFMLRSRKGRERWISGMYSRLVREAPEQEQHMVKTIISLSVVKWVLAAAYMDELNIWNFMKYKPFTVRDFPPPTGDDLEKPPRSPAGTLLVEGQQTVAAVAEKPADRRTYVIVGSGAGGAVAGVTLQEQDPEARIVMLEAGPLVTNDRFKTNLLDTVAVSYMNAALTLSQDQQFIFQQGRGVGGSTVVNNSVAYKPEGFWWTDNIVDRWKSLGVELDWDDLYSQYDILMKRLHVEPVADVVLTQNARTLDLGFQNLHGNPDFPDFNIVRAPANLIECIGCGRCNYGCQYEAKQSMLTAILPDFVRAGGLLVPDAKVERIVFAPSSNGRRVASGVEVQTPDGKTTVVECDRLILAPGAYASSKLLWESGFQGVEPGVRTVGKRFSVNPGTPVVGVMPEPQDGFAGQQIGFAIEVPRERMIIETGFAPPGVLGLLVPSWGARFQERLRQVNQMASAVPVIGSVGVGQIRRGFLGESGYVIDYELADQDWRRIEVGMKMAATVLFEMGATEVFLNRFDARVIHSPDQIEDYFAALDPTDFIFVQSAHLQGGNVISSHPYKGVVDEASFQVHGMDNVWVLDASIIPSPITLNIALTVMALARYGATRIAAL